ncbi:MAG: hypothetical protein ABF264_03435 [Flavobacteriales bacterium]|jgi:hypothetical protein
MNKILLKLILFLLSLSIFGCKKDEKYSEIPEIEFVSLTPNSTTEFSQNIVLKLTYKDGDGDIGHEDPDVYALFVKDSRLPQADEYHVKPLTPPEQTLQIEGELTVRLSSIFVLGSDSTESTKYRVKLRDRAGNWSNEIETSSIQVSK